METNVLKFLIIITNHHQKLSHSYIPVMFSTIKTPISFASEQLKTSTFDKLPQAVGYLTEQMEQIRQMVAALQPQTSSDKHRLVEIDEACKITRKAKPTIYTLARKGLIPAYKRGKKLYFYEDELLQWIESGRKQMQAMSLQEQAAEIVHGAKRKPKGGYNF